MGRHSPPATWILPLLVALCSPVACTGPGANRPTCPESRHVRCLTPLVCSHDDKRDCDVCACEPPVGAEPATLHPPPPQVRADPIR